jgi:DNA-binding LytR/AlgR family response regulator
MNCIIVDDEPLGRKAIELLVAEMPKTLTLTGSFSNAEAAGKFLADNEVSLVFLDIRMPGIDGIEFARSISRDTLVIFTTAYPQYAVDSYELDAIDYLLKPVEQERFRKAVAKAADYLALLTAKPQTGGVESVTQEQIFVKADRRFYRILLRNILFIEGLKDYAVIHTTEKKIIAKTTLKALAEQLPADIFLRTNKSYIVNVNHIDSFDGNDIFIGRHELAIGASYRDGFLGSIFERS